MSTGDLEIRMHRRQKVIEHNVLQGVLPRVFIKKYRLIHGVENGAFIARKIFCDDLERFSHKPFEIGSGKDMQGNFTPKIVFANGERDIPRLELVPLPGSSAVTVLNSPLFKINIGGVTQQVQEGIAIHPLFDKWFFRKRNIRIGKRSIDDDEQLVIQDGYFIRAVRDDRSAAVAAVPRYLILRGRGIGLPERPHQGVFIIINIEFKVHGLKNLIMDFHRVLHRVTIGRKEVR